MKPYLVVLMLVIVLSLAACAPTAPAPTATAEPPTATAEPPTATLAPPTPTGPTPTLPPAARSKAVSVRLTSAALADNRIGNIARRNLKIHLPPSYDTSDKRYPVIYALPLSGVYGTATDFQIPDAIDHWVLAGKMPEVILVEVDMSSMFFTSDFCQNNPVVGDWPGYITRDLVEYVDKEYRTLAKADSRALIGLMDSGGYAAHHLGFRYPGVFAIVVDMAGGLGTEPFFKEGILKAYNGKNHVGRTPSGMKSVTDGLAIAMAPNDERPWAPDVVTKVGDEWQLVPEVWEKLDKINPIYDIEAYKNQPDRLKAFLFVHGINDQWYPRAMVLELIQAMKDAGIPVDFREVDAADDPDGHYYWNNDMLLEFLSQQLAAS